MSASLVGSEMCIRDSSRRRRQSGWGGGSPSRSGHSCRRFQSGGSVAVSYTHLTLPTICSV
eukprot:5305460-Alexandrium_andersonii.AAC.1